jgi:hypothetical protein
VLASGVDEHEQSRRAGSHNGHQATEHHEGSE